MPTYEYLCRDCGHREEHVFTMIEVVDQVITCSECAVSTNRTYVCTLMQRLITGGSGTIFRGDGWVDKDLRRAKEDRKIQSARHQAMRLKTSETVPWKEQIRIQQAEGMYDRLGTEMRKKEADKAESGDLDRQMDGQLNED